MSNEDRGTLAPEDSVEELAKVLSPLKKEEVLAVNDARIILSVYGKRKSLKEDHKPNPYGYATWWLTHETRVQRATADLIRMKGSKYIIRPDFILNSI
jgi:hypothetical protein